LQAGQVAAAGSHLGYRFAQPLNAITMKSDAATAFIIATTPQHAPKVKPAPLAVVGYLSAVRRRFILFSA
jgi:hypothetical protein